LEPGSHEHPAAKNELAGVGPAGQAQEHTFEQPMADRIQDGRLSSHAGQCSQQARGGPEAARA
jgi:hypothetical protein